MKRALLTVGELIWNAIGIAILLGGVFTLFWILEVSI